ncbi:hypothetical protein P3T73_08875 [Kiritimatiellota bacterium B12222]|nr:hypothetical protein P3T73_08875 [Kiritimatiellota bacterium B12222]
MKSLSTDPFQWITSALGNTIGGLLLYVLSYSLGAFATTCDPWIFFWGFMSLPISFIFGWGFIFAPITIWICWAIIFDIHNKYILCSINMLIGAFLSAIGFNEPFPWQGYIILALPIGVLFLAWHNPVKQFIHYLRHRKYDGIEFDETPEDLSEN